MNQPKILVVDDDKEIVGAIKKRLEMEDYEIITAYDGLEAMDVLMEQEVQLLIIDVMMPKMDGWEVVKEIRKVRTSRSSFFQPRQKKAIRSWDYLWEPTTISANHSAQMN